MEDSLKKRKRKENYTSEETLKLIECVREYQHIVESKKPDAFTWKQKDKAWERISQEYNRSNTNLRTAKMLRSKYETLKKEARKYATAQRQSSLQTGGGSPNNVKRNLILDKVQKIMSSDHPPCVCDLNEMSEALRMEAEINSDENSAIIAEAIPELLKFDMSVPVLSSESVHNLVNISELNMQDQPLKCPVSTVDAGKSAAPQGSMQCHLTKNVRASSESGQMLNSWVAEKCKVAALKQNLMKEQFTQKERREQELHEINIEIKKTELQIKKAELINQRLDIKIKRKTLKKLEESQ